jgi:hypothetical protein
MTTNASAIEYFVAELRADDTFGACADGMAEALEELAIEADSNEHSKQLLKGLMLIAQEPGPLIKRVSKQCRLLSLTGKVFIPDTRKWNGWH